MSDIGPQELLIAEGRVERVHSAEELRACVAKLSSEIDADRPQAVSFEAVRSHHVSFGVGGDESFVQVVPTSAEPPCLVTVGDREAQGETAFWLHEIHHSEIPRRNLVAAAVALDIVSEFVFEGTLSCEAEWEEI